MATQQEINQITGLYVAYFDRAPDPAGLQFWVDQLDNGREFATISQDFATSPEATAIYAFLDNPANSSSTAFVQSIYQNLFGRQPEQAGLDFWVGVLDNGDVAPGDMVEAVMLGARDAVVDGTLVYDATIVANRIDCALAWTNEAIAQEAETGETFPFNASALASARSVIDGVDESQASIDAAKAKIANFFDGGDSVVLEQPTSVEITPAVAATLVTETVVYWGYNPNIDGQSDVDNTAGGNTSNLFNENAADGGIPADAFFGTQAEDYEDGYLFASTGATLSDMFNFAEVDVDEEEFIAQLQGGNITQGGGGATANLSLTITYPDASTDDIAIIEGFFDLVNDLFFDAEGNTRFFEKEVAAQIPVYLTSTGEPTTDPTQAANPNDPIGSIDATIGGSGEVTSTTTLPIVFTTTASTQSDGQRATDANDYLQAGTLDMLHMATIDGGGGSNTLSIEAKGEFAQPKLLDNIQQVTIENLPNIYDVNGSTADTDSVIDLSTANQLLNVTLTEGSYTQGNVSPNDAGTLTVSGVSNDATVTFQGGFNNGDINVFTSTGTSNPTFIFDNVSANDSSPLGALNFNVGHNGGSMTFQANGNNSIESLGSYNSNGEVTDLAITGSGSLFVESNLAAIMASDTPVTINAAANNGGVDLNMNGSEQVTFVGSNADDRFAVDTANSTATNQGPDYDDDESVTITNAAGDNYYDIDTYRLSLTEGGGDNNVELDAAYANISAGDGNNFVQGTAAQAMVTLGEGNNRVDLQMIGADGAAVFGGLDDVDQKIDITAGDGANQVTIDLDNTNGQITSTNFVDAAEINITLGDGGNTIILPAAPVGSLDPNSPTVGGALSDVTINTGDGNDTMLVGGSNITINSGGGNDNITLIGIDNDFVTEVGADKEYEPSNAGAVLNINTGTGSATITLGASNNNAFSQDGTIVASEGSVITGSDITLLVDTHADLRAADLSGITSIIMDDDATGYTGQGYPSGSNSTQASNATNSSSLTLLDTQFDALGEGVFSTQGSTFGAQSVVTIVVTQTTSFSSLVDVSALDPSVKICLVIEDGVEFTMTAAELHNYIVPEGVNVTNTNGYNDNQLIITDAGPTFDAFNQQNGGTGGGTVNGQLTSSNDVTIIVSQSGYERPQPDVSAVLYNIDSDNPADNPANVTTLPTVTDLNIFGADDLTVNGAFLVDENADFDFSGLTGDFTDVTDGIPTVTILNLNGFTDGTNPDDWGMITGNGTSADPARVDFLVEDGSTTGQSGILDGGLHSAGVQYYVLTGFHNPVAPNGNGAILSQAATTSATIFVCDSTEDLEVLGLQNNRNATVTYEQVNWGTEILFEGDGYANASDQEKNLGNPDLSEVGAIVANFFEAGANATIRITNQGTELGMNEDAEDGFDANGERVLDVAGITVTNADRMLIAVEDGDAKINAISGVDVERLIVTGPEDVEIVVDGIGDVGGESFDSDDLVQIDGTGVVDTFKLTFTADADLSGVAVTGVDAICLDDNVTLTLTADQVVDLGGIIDSVGSGTSLNVVGLTTQALDLTTVDVDSIGTVTFADVDGTIVVNAATNFGDAAPVTILAESTDTTVEMTYDQFETIGDGNSGGSAVTIEEDGGNDGTLSITNIPNDQQINLLDVDDGQAPNTGTANDGTVVLNATDLVATDDFAIQFDGNLDDVQLVMSGTNDLTEVPLSGLLSSTGPTDIPEMVLEDGAVLTITADQLDAILQFAATNEDGITVNGSATINLIDWDANNDADLDELVADNPGLSFGTVSIENTDTAFTIDANATFGGATVVMPTASPNEGAEQTEITMTVAQFQSTSGAITGDGTVNLTGAANNNDSDNDNQNDNFILDVSGITAPRGTISILEDGPTTTNGETLTLDASTDISGFEILLTDGQRIEFATETQAATDVTDATIGNNPIAVVWLFESVTGPVDTSGYDSAIDTLFIPETLVDFIVNEENLWTTLAGSIVVEKYNDAAPRGLVAFNRVNTFEAFGATVGVITYDDQDEFETIGSLTLNLEGNVSIAGIVIDETNGDSGFNGEVNINSYLDVENMPDSVTVNGALPDLAGTLDETAIQGINVLPNTIGDITLNSEVLAGETVEININTGTQADTAVASGGQGQNPLADDDAGQPLVVGTIFLGEPAAGESTADINLQGDNDVTIGGINTDSANLTQVNVNVAPMTIQGGADPDLTIAGVDYGDLANSMSGFTSIDQITIIDNLTATDTTVLNGNGVEVMLEVRGASNDLKEVLAANFDVDGVYVTEAGTLTLTGDQLAAIGIDDANTDNVADNWVLGPGLNPNDVTIDICDINLTNIDLDAIAAAGFNIGTITITADTVLGPNTTLGGADEIVIELGSADTNISLEMTAEQYNGFSGVITEQLSANPVNPTATYTGQVIIDELEAIEDTNGQVNIDFSTVATTGDNTVMLSENTGGTTPEPSATAVTGGNNDVTLSATTLLGNFQIILNDVETATSSPTANELAGQTIRFTTVDQADGRTVVIFEAESTDAEQDTNVIWAFDVIPGPNGLDVSGYDENLGRVWITDDLLDSVNGDIDSLFTIDDNGTLVFTLDGDIIKRVTNDNPLTLDPTNVAVNQIVELEAGLTITNLTAEIADPSQYIETLQIDAGGLVTVGDVVIDNLVGTNVLGDDDFETLTINSFLADFYNGAQDHHYLLPDSFNPNSQALPSNSTQFPNPTNAFGDILAGGNRGILRNVEINTGDGDATIEVTAATAAGGQTVSVDYTVNGGGTLSTATVTLTDATDAALVAEEIAAALDGIAGISATASGSNVIVNSDGNGNGDDDIDVVAVNLGGTLNGLATVTSNDDGERGTDFVAQTIFLSEDTTPISNTGMVTITGTNDVTLKSIDSTDAEITSVTIDTSDHTGSLTVTGGSPAFDGGDAASDTDTLTITNGNSDTGVITLASTIIEDDVNTPLVDEFDITYTTGNGQPAPWAGVSSADLETIDTTGHDGTISLGVISEINGDTFTLDSGAGGQLYACLGQGIDDGNVETPTLNAGGTWTFDGANIAGDNTIDLEMKAANLGAGDLVLTDVDLVISGAVDMTGLNALTVNANSTIDVEAGATLTLTVEQVDALETAGIIVSGEGTVVVTGESDSAVAAQDTTFGDLRTATVDLSAVTLDAADTILEIDVNGAEDADGNDLEDANGDRVAQTIIGSANDDTVTINASADDSDPLTTDVILRLGADGGDIGVAGETPSANTPTDATPEVAGDVIINNTSVNTTIEVDAGYDQIDVIGDDQNVQVASGAEFYAASVDGQFVATADDTNDGTAVIELDGTADETIDMALAGGTNGWYLIGASDATTGSESTLIGSAQADWLIDGLANTNDNDGHEDSFTGGAGADNFVFAFASSEPATLTPAVTTVSVDQDVITVGAVEASDVDAADEIITITYQVADTTTSLVVSDAGIYGPIDFTSASDIAAAIAAELNAVNGITAAANTPAAGDITVTDVNGEGFEIVAISVANMDTITAGDITDVDGTQAAGVVDVTIAFGPNQLVAAAGEVYTLTAQLSNGTNIQASYTASNGDSEAVIAAALEADFNATSALLAVPNTNGVTATSAGSVITLTDQNTDNGGFTVVTANGSATVNAASASSVLTGAETSLADADADVITDFVSADDSISFGLAAGTNSNYDEEAQVADYVTAAGNANTAFGADSNLVYFLSSTAADGGLLFVNLDGDGQADAVVNLVGVDSTTFDEADIV